MDEKHLRQLIETNFQLLSLTMRDMGARVDQQGGVLSQTTDSLAQTQDSLAQTQESLARTQESLAQTQELLGEFHELAIANRDALFEAADRVDETLEAIKLLAFGAVEDRQRIGSLEEKYVGLESRIERLEETG